MVKLNMPISSDLNQENLDNYKVIYEAAKNNEVEKVNSILKDITEKKNNAASEEDKAKITKEQIELMKAALRGYAVAKNLADSLSLLEFLATHGAEVNEVVTATFDAIFALSSLIEDKEAKDEETKEEEKKMQEVLDNLEGYLSEEINVETYLDMIKAWKDHNQAELKPVEFDLIYKTVKALDEEKLKKIVNKLNINVFYRFHSPTSKLASERLVDQVNLLLKSQARPIDAAIGYAFAGMKEKVEELLPQVTSDPVTKLENLKSIINWYRGGDGKELAAELEKRYAAELSVQPSSENDNSNKDNSNKDNPNKDNLNPDKSLNANNLGEEELNQIILKLNNECDRYQRSLERRIESELKKFNKLGKEISKKSSANLTSAEENQQLIEFYIPLETAMKKKDIPKMVSLIKSSNKFKDEDKAVIFKDKLDALKLLKDNSLNNAAALTNKLKLASFVVNFEDKDFQASLIKGEDHGAARFLAAILTILKTIYTFGKHAKERGTFLFFLTPEQILKRNTEAARNAYREEPLLPKNITSATAA